MEEIEDLDIEQLSADNLEEVNVSSFVGHKDDVNCCAFSSDWKMLLTCADDHTLHLWDMSSKSLLWSKKGHKGPVKCCCFSKSQQLAASGCFCHVVIVWNVLDGSIKACLEGHSLCVETVSFSPDETFLCSGSWDCTAILWNLSSNVPQIILDGHGSVVQSCAFSTLGKHLATGSWDYIVRVWKISDKVDHWSQVSLKGHTGNIKVLKFSPQDENKLVSSSWDCTVRVWNILSRCCTLVLHHGGWVQNCCFSVNGRALVTVADDELLKIWDIDTGGCVKELQTHTEEVQAIAMTTSGHLLASGPLQISLYTY